MIGCVPRVLVVDDEWDTRTIINDYLTHRGCPVSQAVDGAAALAQIAADPPDVILLDIGLLDVSGTELFADIQAQCPNAAVIFISALNQGELAAELVRRGAVHYLVKPIQMSRLWATVQEAWAARQARLEKTAPLHELTPREHEVLALLGEGKTDDEIAKSLAIRKSTAKTHIHHILDKLNLRGRIDAALWWQRNRTRIK